MRKIATVLASGLVLALAACGDSEEVAEEAIENTVEIPADEAMVGVPEPQADVVAEAEEDASESVDDAVEAAEQAADAAEQAAQDAAAAAEAANELPADPGL